MTIQPFHPGDFWRLKLQPAQEYLASHITPEIAMRYANHGPALTAWKDGRPIMCGGAYAWTDEGAMLWAWFSDDSGRHFYKLHRATERFIDTLDYPRLVALCRSGFVPAARWLEMLGFSYLRTVPEYGPECAPHDCYLRVT